MTKHIMPRALGAFGLLAAAPSALIGSVRADAGLDPAKIEKLLGEVKQELTRVGDDVKKTAEQALQQSKTAGDVSAEVKNTADKLLTAQSALEKAQGDLRQQLEVLSTRNTDLEQKLAGRRGSADEPRQTLGQMVAGNDKVKAFIEGGASGQVRITVQNAITSATGSGGGLINPQRDTEVIGIPKRTMTIRSLLSVGRTTSNLVQYAKQLARTNNAAVVAETTMKPESIYTWTTADAPVRTIAHWVPISRQAMDDIPQLQGELDDELRYGLDLSEEAEILKGNGTGEHLSGLIPNATAYDAPLVIAGRTKIDVLRLAILQASLAEYPADGMVLHPSDWAGIELTKDADNRYIFANVQGTVTPQLWGKPVVGTQANTLGDFLVGAFRAAAKIYDRMDVEVLLSTEDRDNFVKNMITARAEKRLALAVRRPAALVYGNFAAALA